MISMDPQQIVVEKGIPLPVSVRAAKYPFSTMDIKDSFVMPACMKQLVRSHALAYKRANPGWDYQTKVTEEGIRLWRTA